MWFSRRRQRRRAASADHVTQWAYGRIFAGFATLPELLNEVADYAVEEKLDVQSLQETVRRMWADRMLEQANWPTVTDATRLDRAFATLESDGIVARMDFTCCPSCGQLEIYDEVPPGSAAHGYVFFHNQDSDCLPEGFLCLNWGVLVPLDDDDESEEPEDAAVLNIGRRIIVALERRGLTVEWDGTPTQRICVTNLNWQRHLPTV